MNFFDTVLGQEFAKAFIRFEQHNSGEITEQLKALNEKLDKLIELKEKDEK